MFEIILGCFLLVAGIFGKEFYPGRAGKSRGLPSLNPWIGKAIFIAFGLAFIALGLQSLRH